VRVCVYRASELFYLYLCLVLAVSNGVVRSQLFSGLLGGHLYLGLSPLLALVSTVGKPRLVVVAVQGAPEYGNSSIPASILQMELFCTSIQWLPRLRANNSVGQCEAFAISTYWVACYCLSCFMPIKKWNVFDQE